MHRFLPLAALFTVACAPGLEGADEADLLNKTAPIKDAIKLFEPCYDERGNPINQSAPHCQTSHGQLMGSAGNPDIHPDPLARGLLSGRIYNDTMYFAAGVDGTALVGATSRTSTLNMRSSFDTSSAQLAVFAPSTETATYQVPFTSRLGTTWRTVTQPATVSAIVWGDFDLDGINDAVIVLDNGSNFEALSSVSGAFTGTWELGY